MYISTDIGLTWTSTLETNKMIKIAIDNRRNIIIKEIDPPIQWLFFIQFVFPIANFEFVYV